MDKIKRNERLAAMTQILTASPNHIFTLSYFCDLFSTAKSTISEDIDLVSNSFDQFDLGRIETVAGAAGGVRQHRRYPDPRRIRHGLCGGAGSGQVDRRDRRECIRLLRPCPP